MKNTLLHSFKYSDSQDEISILIIVVGAAWLIAMLMIPSVGLTAFPVGIIAFGIALIVMNKNKDCVRIHEDFFEYRKVRYLSLTAVNFEEIKDVEINDKLIIIHLLKTNEPIRLYKSPFNKIDLPIVDGILKNFNNKKTRLSIQSTHDHNTVIK